MRLISDDPLDLVSEEFDPDDVIEVAGDEVDGVAFHPESPGYQLEVIPSRTDLKSGAAMISLRGSRSPTLSSNPMFR